MPTMKIPRIPIGHTLHVIACVRDASRNTKNAARMTHTPIGYHHAWCWDGPYIMGGATCGTVGAVPGPGGPMGTGNRGITERSAPHFSQYFASASFRAPHRLQNIVDHPRLMLPVVVWRVTWNFIVVEPLVYVPWSGAYRRAFVPEYFEPA